MFPPPLSRIIVTPSRAIPSTESPQSLIRNDHPLAVNFGTSPLSSIGITAALWSVSGAIHSILSSYTDEMVLIITF
jgi:hypothetical protein